MNFINPKKIISQSAVPIASVIADFGFGKGDFLRHLSREAGPEGKVYAIDIQEDIVKRVSLEFRELGIKNVNFLSADLGEEKSTQLDSATVDFVLISSLFFQNENKENIAKEALRILKPGGRILFIDWRESFAGIGPEKKLIFSEDQAILFWKNYPMDLERRVDSGKYHYGLIYRKK